MDKTLGLASPTFVIEKDNKYYLTLSVLEYDPQAAQGNMTLVEGVNAIQAAFNRADKYYRAAEVVYSTLTAAAQTQPRRLSFVSYAQTEDSAQTNP